jgi:hypothetical protein
MHCAFLLHHFSVRTRECIFPLFLLLTDGQMKVIEYRDEAIKMLKEFKKGELYDFRLAYATQYRTSFQLKIKT